MSNWWETKADDAWGGGASAPAAANGADTWAAPAADKWGAPAAANVADAWAAPAQAPAAAGTDIATKIEQLKGGKWSDGWKEFQYYDASSGSWVSDPIDNSIGQPGKGWWRFLYHEGECHQPEDLAALLEKQQGSTVSAPPGFAAPAEAAPSQWGQSWDTAAATPAAAPASDNWGNWNKGADTTGGADAGWSAPAPNAKAFWEMQKWNKDGFVLSRKSETELEQDDMGLFPIGLSTNEGVDFSVYENVPVDVSGEKSANIPCLETFEAIYQAFSDQIPDACVENVRKCQYRVPTPVQKYAVPVGLAGRDVMCCAQTGSGKTAAFLIPTIGLMMKHHPISIGALEAPFEGKCKPDTLVMTPTRELCIQIHEEALKFCHRTGYRCCRVYGGEHTKVQLEDLSKGCDLMVACPGRLQDFINREVIDLSEIYLLVLDEADRMLDMGFEKEIRAIVENHGMPQKEDRQTMMFSATFPEECQKMAQDFLWDYIWIGVGIVGGAVTTVTQALKKVVPSDKYNSLIEALDNFYLSRTNGQRCLVFVNAKDTAKWLDEQLYTLNYDSGALHGNLDQHERETNLGRFRKGEIDVLVATDLAARGLDVEKVDLVINYDMPAQVDTYVHRIGRSGRIGNRGAAVTYVSVDEDGKCFENTETLAKLLKIMSDAGSEIPDWLEGFTTKDSWDDKDKGGAGAWSNWGGKDARASW